MYLDTNSYYKCINYLVALVRKENLHPLRKIW